MYMIRANLLISLVMLKLISRYAGIGVINTAIHWTVFALILKLFESGQAMANFGAFCVAVTFSFLLMPAGPSLLQPRPCVTCFMSALWEAWRRWLAGWPTPARFPRWLP